MPKTTTAADDDAPRPRPVVSLRDLFRRARAGDEDARRALVALLAKTPLGKRIGKPGARVVWGRLPEETDE